MMQTYSPEQLMNSELEKVWFHINILTINFSKATFMSIKSRHEIDSEVNIKIENEDGTLYLLGRKDRVKYLGILLDETVSFYHKISYVCTLESEEFKNGILTKLKHITHYLIPLHFTRHVSMGKCLQNPNLYGYW